MFDLETIIRNWGLWAIGFMVFAESGLLFGFFFPGDTLLLVAGITAAQGSLNLPELLVVVVITAILGGNVGYSIGRRAGPRLFTKKDGIFFRHEYIEKAERFYEKHGGKTIMFARFIAIIRTFAPVVAGIGKMNRAAFLFYNIVGSTIWGIGIIMLGYYFGSRIPNIDNYVVPAVSLIFIASFAPAIYHIFKNENARQKIKNKFASLLRLLTLNKK